MKTLAILFTLFYFLNALAVAPYGFKGQNQTQTLYSNVLQFPNNQITNLGGINALVEVGNKNILTNPSFEHATFSTGWTNSAGTFTKETAVKIDGLNAAKLVLSAQTMSLTQSSTLYNAQFADGVQGLASVRVKSDVALKVCSIQAGTVSTTNCVDVLANSKWGLYKVPFILGGTSNGISIASTGAVSGTVYIDDAFVGAVDLQASVDASKVAGYAYFAPTASCVWPRTSTTLGAFTATAACPGPTIGYSSMGSWQTTDSDLPRVTVNNLPSGVYKATFILAGVPTLAASNSFAINDGSTTCQTTSGPGAVSDPTNTVLSCIFTYASSANRVFEIYGQSSANTIQISNTTSTGFNPTTKFFLEYFGSSSVYTSTNSDTDWASCNLTGSAFTGFGSSVPTPSLQCKRQGADLLIKGTFTAGTTPTAVEARMALPIWNGVQLVSAGSSIIPSVQLAGNLTVNLNSTTFFGEYVLIEPSVSYLTFGIQSSTLNAFSKSTGSSMTGTGNSHSINARIPIEGWQGSNIIVGSFNGLQNCTSTLACTDTFSAKVSSAGVVSDENVDWINGNASLATSTYTISFNSSIFTITPNCTYVSDANNQLVDVIGVSSSSTNVVVKSGRTDTGAALAGSFQIICQKQGADYVGKTAMAVASDQNVRSIGSTGMDIQSAYFGGGANCSSVCSSGNCTICNQVGSKITSISFVSSGTYNINGIDGTKYFCFGAADNGVGLTTIRSIKSLSTSTYSQITNANYSTSTNALNASVICIGIP